jgi:hypothetical protein
MSSYHDPALRGDVYPSEEEIDPADAGVEPGPALTPGPAPRIDTEARSIVSDGDGQLDTVVRTPNHRGPVPCGRRTPTGARPDRG